MPKSYKICHCPKFNKQKFDGNTLELNIQPHLDFYDNLPDKTITRLTRYNNSVYDNFEQYLIEHEHNVNVKGRYQNQIFNNFYRMGEINGYYSESTQLFLFQGRKNDVLDFCKFTDKSKVLDINTIEIQMSDLLDKLGSINNGWFRYKDSSISTSALFGSHLENTQEFIDAKNLGELSALSFYYNENNTSHAIMVTSDGAIVLQYSYPNVQIEIDLILRVKRDLLDGIYTQVPTGKRKKKAI